MELTTVQVWIAAILGDILLIGGVFALINRWMAANIGRAIKDSMTPVATEVKALTDKAEELGKVQGVHTEQLAIMAASVSKISYQVQPNRGSSLRDTTDRTEILLGELDGKVDSALLDIALLKSKIKD
jgi:hypothetical protein